MGDRLAALRCFCQAQSGVDETNPQATQIRYQLYHSSVIQDPTLAQGWLHVGHANAGLDCVRGAIAAYRRAIELPDSDGEGGMTPDDRAKTLVTIGHMLQRIGRIDEALKYLHAGLGMDDKLSLGWLNLSLCAKHRGRLKEAVEYGVKAFEMEPDNCAVEMGLAFALLWDGQWAKGLKHFEARFPYRLKNFLSYPMPKWEGVEGVDVMLVGDQGIGDTLSFARFVPLVAKRARFVHLCVQPELVRLFQAAFANIPNKNILALPCPWPPAQFWTTFVSIPTALGLSDEVIADTPHIPLPNFNPPDTSWKSTDRKYHIGVSWAGSPANDIDVFRSFPVTQLLELYRVPGVQLYSLQVGDRAMELHTAGAASLLRDLAPFIRDISDTLGILKHLDMVICCESALGHISTLAGKEVWMPYGFMGTDYRIGFDGSNQLWSKHRIFKQGWGEEWGAVFNRIVDALKERVEGLDMRVAAE